MTIEVISSSIAVVAFCAYLCVLTQKAKKKK